MFADPETWVAVSFILFLALMVYLKVPARVATALDGHAAGVARQLDEARKLREEAEAVLDDYRKKTARIETESAAILSQAAREAAAYVNETRAAFDEMMTRRMNLAELKIKQEEERARKEIRAQAAALAIAAARELLEQKVTGQLADDMIASSIDKIKKRLN